MRACVQRARAPQIYACPRGDLFKRVNTPTIPPTCTHAHTHAHTHTHTHSHTHSLTHTLTHTRNHPYVTYREAAGLVRDMLGDSKVTDADTAYVEEVLKLEGLRTISDTQLLHLIKVNAYGCVTCRLKALDTLSP